MRAGAQCGKIRPPAVAGRFYAAEPDRLQAEVSSLLLDASSLCEIPPKALIVLHAGHVYSGRVAAAAFAMLRDNEPTIKRVVLIGPAHYVAVCGIAAPSVNAFETPLSHIPVDQDALTALDDLPFVVQSDAAHAPEHSLEVQLPFLQTLLASFRVVPLVVGDSLPREVALVLRRLWGGPETLILVSSDLSHYHDYDTARRLDTATAAAFERNDWTGLGPD